MTEYLKLIHERDWNGGRLMIDGTKTQIKTTTQLEPSVLIFKCGRVIGCGIIDGERLFDGKDPDHGHTVHWSAFDLNITLPPTGFGVTARALFAQGFEVFVMLEK